MILRIKDILKERKMSAVKLAEAVGITQPNMSNIVNGKSMPSLETLEKIARVLNVEVWELFTPSTSTADFMALVKDGGNYYHASSFAELKGIVNEIELSHG